MLLDAHHRASQEIVHIIIEEQHRDVAY